MKNIVLLTSALYTNYGIYNPQERIKQTLETAKSAKNAVVSDFLTWVLSTYAPANADALGYAPLTGAMQTAGRAQAKKVNSK